MTNKFFLHTESLLVQNFEAYKIGISKLIEVKIECDSNDVIFKHENIYNSGHYSTLCHNLCDEASIAILQYIEQCTSHKVDISNDTIFAKEFPIYNTGFMGIDFSQFIDIRKERQVRDKDSFLRCKSYYYKCLIRDTEHDISDCLLHLFPDYKFENEAIDDIRQLKNIDKTLVDRLIKLLQDIKPNPFTGGIGKTEVLKHLENVASKRITDEHRLTYTYNKSQTIVYRCFEHYK